MGRTRGLAIVRTSVVFILGLAPMALGCSDGGTGPEAFSIDAVAGRWDNSTVTAIGAPIQRFELSLSGNTLSGDTYWISGNRLVRVGSLTGEIKDNGEATWTTQLEITPVANQLGHWGVSPDLTSEDPAPSSQTGPALGATEVVEGVFVSGAFQGTGSVFAADGSPVGGGSVSLEPWIPVVPAPGTGPFGEAGPWQGIMIYASLGQCSRVGYVLTLTFSGNNTASMTGVGSIGFWDFTDGGPRTPDDFYGNHVADVVGIQLEGQLVVGISSPLVNADLVRGAVTVIGSSATSFVGDFSTLPGGGCVDEYGENEAGGWTLVGGHLDEIR